MENPNAAKDPALLIAAENEVTEQRSRCLALVYRCMYHHTQVYMLVVCDEELMMSTTPTVTCRLFRVAPTSGHRRYSRLRAPLAGVCIMVDGEARS